jgi:UDP-glucose 4-epimerase
MKALVTGGAGFIGSHLVDRLLGDGWSVRVIDNMTCGYRSNLQQHEPNKELEIYEADIRDPDVVRKLVKGCNTVFHIAAHANIRTSLEDHRVDLENNVIGTINILDAMISNGVHDLVFASTSALYGEAELRPSPENYASVQTSLYGASKLACEAYAEAFTQFAPLKFWAFRFANVIGERCRRGVIWDFVHKLQTNPKELEILGDGKQSKEYLYVKDCVDGMIIGYQKASDAVNIFNLGMDQQTIVDEVADVVIEEMKLGNVSRRYVGGPRGWIGDNPIVELSLDRIKRLGWKPQLSSKEAIRRTARWTLDFLHTDKEKLPMR